MILLTLETETLRQAALRIGKSLSVTAFWDTSRRRCNWMGRTDVEDASMASVATCSAALLPHLYSGTSGIGLFLAELYGRTGDPEILETAHGAIRHALRSWEHSSGPASPLSFSAGLLGPAYAALRLMDVHPEAGLQADVEVLVDRIARSLDEPHALDLMGGNAGAIPVLLALSRRPGLEQCLDIAMACGRELCETADREGGLCAWNAARASGPGFGNSPPMTGFSHGASGMGLALLELHAVSGEPDLLTTARGAFAYEDTLFRPAYRNWLDVRFSGPDSFGVAREVCQIAWCHGAPGIAIARLRARTLDPERAEQHTEMARIGLRTTLAGIEAKLGAPRHDASLCHGLCGLAETVLIAAEELDPEYRQTSLQVAAELRDRYGEPGDWPSGAPGGGPNPTLMIGNAGIGYFLLRLEAPREIPSILRFTPGI